MLKVHDLVLGYTPGSPIVHGVSFTVPQCSVVALMGRNGAGKSTVLRGIIGALIPERGNVEFEGIDITGKTPRELSTFGIGYIAQGGECFPELTVRDNLIAALLPLRLSRAQKKEALKRSLSFFPIMSSLLGKSARSLSGGQRQILVASMAFARSPRLLIVDEPSLGMSEAIVVLLESVLRRFADFGGSILIVEQKPKIIFRIADYVYYLEHGKIKMEGCPAELRADSEFVERYLGTV